MPRLTRERKEAFFRALEAYKKKGGPFPDGADDEAEDIRKKLGEGWKANLIQSGKPKEEATNAGAEFQRAVNRFIEYEPLNPDPDINPTPDQAELHRTHRRDVIQIIVVTMGERGSNFTHESVEQSELYWARMAAPDVQRLIESPEKRHERKTGRETVSLQEHEEQGHEVSDAASPHFPRPESVIERMDLQDRIQRQLRSAGDKWLALFLLCNEGGYTWEEIALSLQGAAPPGGWARNPAEVWGDIKSGYTLPDWNTVRGWFPPPPLNAGALRVFYHRGIYTARTKVCPHRS
jgi:hypothetical protein